MNINRRMLCQTMGGLLGLWSLSGCSQPAPAQPARTYTEEEQRRMHKFRGIGGAEWVLSSVHELRYIEIRNQDGFIISSPAELRPDRNSMFGARVPVRLAVTWREEAPDNPISFVGKRNAFWSGGKITGSFEIPVADRIPDDLLDDLRRDPKGSLRIKIRLHREGVLLGWDIERRLNPRGFTREQINERHIHIAPAYSHTGGDFKEARAAHFMQTPLGFVELPMGPELNGVVPKEWAAQGLYITSGKDPCCDTRVKNRLWEKGWYIHPKTGERIESYF